MAAAAGQYRILTYTYAQMNFDIVLTPPPSDNDTYNAFLQLVIGPQLLMETECLFV